MRENACKLAASRWLLAVGRFYNRQLTSNHRQDLPRAKAKSQEPKAKGQGPIAKSQKMKISEANQLRILSTIGLTLGSNIIHYPEGEFKQYISTEYKNSERFKSDEIYRMFEINLLHIHSGLRIVYTTAESYYGDSVEYKLIRMFIITQDQKQLDIEDVDFSEAVFVTAAGIIAFSEVDGVGF